MDQGVGAIDGETDNSQYLDFEAMCLYSWVVHNNVG